MHVRIYVPFFCLHNIKATANSIDASKITNSDVMITPTIKPVELLFSSLSTAVIKICNYFILITFRLLPYIPVV